MTARGGEWRARLLLVGISVVAGAGLGEVGGRVLLRPEAGVAPGGTPISEISPTLGWRTRALGSALQLCGVDVLNAGGPGWPWDRDAVSVRLSRVLARLDIPLLEATAALQKAEKSDRLAYLPAEGHWNARGNEIAFDALLPSMRRAVACGS